MDRRGDQEERGNPERRVGGGRQMEAVRQQRSEVARVEVEPVGSRRRRGGNTGSGVVPDRGGPVDMRRVEGDGKRVGEETTAELSGG